MYEARAFESNRAGSGACPDLRGSTTRRIFGIPSKGVIQDGHFAARSLLCFSKSRMSSPHTTRLRLFQLLCLLVVAAVFAFLRNECLSAELGGIGCLAPAAALFSPVKEFGTLLLNYHRDYYLYELGIAALGVLLIVFTLLFRKNITAWALLYLLALTLTGVGEMFAIEKKAQLVLYSGLAAALAAVLAFALMWRRSPALLSEGWLETKRTTAPLRIIEIVLVAAIMAAGILARFHDLNRNPSGYDAEACPHRLVADSWQEILKQEVGQAVQQSSGMSWVALHKLFTRIDHFNLFYLDERLLGVGISLACCLAIFFFVRNLRGSFAAVLALSLYVFGPLDLDWSRLPVMHHLPVLLGILMAWTALNALSTRSLRSFLLLALLILASKFVYPSAKLIWFGPVAAVVWVLLMERKAWRGHLLKPLVVFLGLAAFVAGRTGVWWLLYGELRIMPPFENPYPTYQTISVFERAQQMLQQGLLFFYELFYSPAEVTHWTNHATVLPVRSISSFCVVFLLAAFVRLLFLFRRPESIVFMGMIVGGLIPGMATGLADRRIAVSIVLCLVLSVLEFSWLMDTVVRRSSKWMAAFLKGTTFLLVTACIFIAQTQSFFSRPASRPVQAEAGDTIRQLVKPSTLVVYLAEERRCEMFYSIYDMMRESGGSIAFANADDSNVRLGDQIRNPTPIVDSWYYTGSDLEPQREKVRNTKHWDHYLFAFQPTPERRVWMTQLRALYPHGREQLVQYDKVWEQKLFIFEVDNAPVQQAPEPSAP